MKISFYSYKGGQGVSTTAALYAVASASMGVRTLFVDLADGSSNILLSLLLPSNYGQGDEPSYPVTVTDNLDWVDKRGDFDPDNYGCIVYDLGVLHNFPTAMPNMVLKRTPKENRVFVTRSCYLSLQKFVTNDDGMAGQTVLITEVGRALDFRDVQRVTNAPVYNWGWSPVVARAVDAGLVAYRVGDHVTHLYRAINMDIKETNDSMA